VSVEVRHWRRQKQLWRWRLEGQWRHQCKWRRQPAPVEKTAAAPVETEVTAPVDEADKPGAQIKNGYELFWQEQNGRKIVGIYFQAKNHSFLSFKLPSTDQYTCSNVAFRTTMGVMKLLLHLLSLITKTCPKGKLVLYVLVLSQLAHTTGSSA